MTPPLTAEQTAELRQLYIAAFEEKPWLDSGNEIFALNAALSRAAPALLAAAEREQKLREALVKLEAALRKDSREKSIVGDTVEYHIDGQAMYHAINAARAALSAREGDMSGPTQDAYDAACKALWKHRDRAEVAEAEAKRLREELEECCNPHRLERMRATEAKLAKVTDTLRMLLDDYLATSPRGWRQPFIEERARAVLAEIDGGDDDR